jgi:hypothetical protein
MPIKFQCPHCKKGLSVKDELAGKKAACPVCKKALTIPRPSAPSAPATPRPAPKKPALPTPPALDVEAEAAAAFADEPPSAAGAAAAEIEVTCDYCEEVFSVGPDLGGKRTQCPSCRRIVKVPMPAKADPTNWKTAGKALPSGAKRSDGPAPEGVWGSTGAAAVVSRDSLDQAGALPARREPLTLRQKIVRGVTAAVVLAVLAGAGLGVYGWVNGNREEKALQTALAYAEQAAPTSPEGAAALHALAGEYYLLANKPFDDAPLHKYDGAAPLARGQYEKALGLLKPVPAGPREGERVAQLAELAAALPDLAGTDEEERRALRLKWDETQKLVSATLTAIPSWENRLAAYRGACRRFIARGQERRVQSLASTAFGERAGERTGALAAGGLELYDAGKKEAAGQVLEQVLKAYDVKNDRPPMAPEAVALAMALGKPPPPAGAKGLAEQDNFLVGSVEGQARQGHWAEARKLAQDAPRDELRLRALVTLAELGRAQNPSDTTDLTAAVQLSGVGRGKADAAWTLYRLARLGARAGLPAEQLKAVADAVADPGLRGRAHLALLRARLDASKQAEDVAAADAVPAQTVAFFVGRAALARHNTHFDAGYGKVVQGWPDAAQQAFGAAGVALGMREGK